MASQAETSPLLQGVCFLAMENSPLGVLEKLQPAFVIVHDPDITFVRQLEVRIPFCLLPSYIFTAATSLQEPLSRHILSPCN